MHNTLLVSLVVLSSLITSISQISPRDIASPVSVERSMAQALEEFEQRRAATYKECYAQQKDEFETEAQYRSRKERICRDAAARFWRIAYNYQSMKFVAQVGVTISTYDAEKQQYLVSLDVALPQPSGVRTRVEWDTKSTPELKVQNYAHRFTAFVYLPVQPEVARTWKTRQDALQGFLDYEVYPFRLDLAEPGNYGVNVRMEKTVVVIPTQFRLYFDSTLLLSTQFSLLGREAGSFYVRKNSPSILKYGDYLDLLPVEASGALLPPR